MNKRYFIYMPLKRFIPAITLMLVLMNSHAQFLLTYATFSVGGTDTNRTLVRVVDSCFTIQDVRLNDGSVIPGTAEKITYVSLHEGLIRTQYSYSDTEKYYCQSEIPNNMEWVDEGVERVNGYRCRKFSTVSFSNKLECWVTEDMPVHATAMASFANLPGLLVKYSRNGNHVTLLQKLQKTKAKQRNAVDQPFFPNSYGTLLTSAALRKLSIDKLCVETVIFEDEQICFNPQLEKPHELPYDQTLRFANGTVILKRVHFDRLPEHYRIFAEVTEYSNGDAYDRTGSVFIIPTDKEISLLKALLDSVGVLPFFTDKSGGVYPGMLATDRYTPPVELVRFFTPFGVRHYNEYRSLDDREWSKEVQYKQDISDLGSMLSGDVYIGVFIGNYDGGGHKVSLRIKAYPEEEVWEVPDSSEHFVLPLFNTCNVMEMAGQNYGRFFRTDSLTVSFDVPEGLSSLTLRYIATGHGGWDRGDEFVPKPNTILLDGKVRFVHTPWRTDCATFRTYNPASGNFWNGMSSSDYSRSGWCPGTATQPVYVNLADLKPGRHTLTVAIPQGEPEGSSFSSWNVSGVLIGERK